MSEILVKKVRFFIQLQEPYTGNYILCTPMLPKVLYTLRWPDYFAGEAKSFGTLLEFAITFLFYLFILI